MHVMWLAQWLQYRPNHEKFHNVSKTYTKMLFCYGDSNPKHTMKDQATKSKTFQTVNKKTKKENAIIRHKQHTG